MNSAINLEIFRNSEKYFFFKMDLVPWITNYCVIHELYYSKNCRCGSGPDLGLKSRCVWGYIRW